MNIFPLFVVIFLFGWSNASPVCLSGYFTADNEFDLFADGLYLGSNNNWSTSTYFMIPCGSRVIAIKGIDIGGYAGILASLNNGVKTGNSWKCTNVYYTGWNNANFNDADWPAATLYGQNVATASHIWGQISNISSTAQWIWTWDNFNHNTVYCRVHLPESDCWVKYGVKCQITDCEPPSEKEVTKQCLDGDCKCCVNPGCYDIGKECASRCLDINADNVDLLSKECRKSCDFCCPCEGMCDLMFQKRGCWKDKINRKLNTLVLNERDRNSSDYIHLEWSTWKTYLPAFVCRCAHAAANAGFRYFGIQFYRECWAGNNMDYDDSGACTGLNKPCIGRHWHECIWPSRPEESESPTDYCCAGKNDCNYVYEIPVNKRVDACYIRE